MRAAVATVLEPKFTREVAESSDRSFGLLFAAFFALIGLVPLLHGGVPRWWCFGVAVAFAAAALARPRILRPLNKAWLALGRLLHRVVSPIVMGAIYFVCVTPIAWVLRLRGNDLLSLKRCPEASSYWTLKEPSAPPIESMKRQF